MTEFPRFVLPSMLDLRNQLPAFASEGHSDRLSLRHLLHAYVKLHANGYLAEVDCGRVSSAFIEHSFQVEGLLYCFEIHLFVPFILIVIIYLAEKI